jgi:vacuolar-type H+-ATPase subunit I/STV1
MINRTLLLLLAAVAFAVFCGQAQAQIFTPPRDPTKDENEPVLGSPQKEMQARLEIQRAEKLRRENLERAREVAQLGTDLRDAYADHKTLAREELKKLERLEKLTRRIRSEAGGSDDDEPLEDAPRELNGAIERIAELSEELRKGVEKTPRLVISTAVIEHSNELLELIKFVRTLSH